MQRNSRQSVLRAAAALAVSLALAAPALGTTSIILPPYRGDAPRIAGARAARAALHSHGVSDIRHMQQEKGYWEAEAMLGRHPVVAYVYDNGAVETREVGPRALMQAYDGSSRPPRG